MTAIGALLLGLIPLFGFVISFQSKDGTLLIESSVDDVTVRVSQGDTVVRKLSVTKAGARLEVAAGSYTVTVEGKVDGIGIENDKVNLRRGGTEIVKLTYQRAATAATPSGDTPTGKSPDADQQLSNIEKSVYVTNVRADGQVLYFTLNQRNAPKGVAAFLEVLFHCEKPMPFVWTGPGPDAATVVSPTHTMTWNGTGHPPVQLPPRIDRLIALPIAANEHKVALIFPDKDSAVVAAKQLAAIGDQSLLDAQRRANSIGGTLRDNGIIFADHPAIGRFTTHFRVLIRTSVPPDRGLTGIPRLAAKDLVGPPNVQMQLAFPAINWRQLYIGRAGEPQLAKSHQISDEQLQRILEITQSFLREATPTTRADEEKRAQSAVQALLTVDQDRLLRREIWVAINATRLRVPPTHEQLGLNSDQRKQIDEIWNKFEEEVRQNRGLRADGSDSYEQIFDDTFEVLTSEQRRLYFFKLQDPVFHSGDLPGSIPRDWNPEDLVQPEKEPTQLVDVLNLHLRRERGRFPMLDRVLEEVRLYELGALDALERPVREDREQYAKDHPGQAKAFEAWQSDFRDGHRATEIIPKLFEDKATRQVMVTVARLLIQSGDIPGITKEKLDEAYQELGEYPSDKRVERVFLRLVKARHSNSQRQPGESVPDVPHTETHESHLKNAETVQVHYEFARLYCGIEQSEMFRQIRKLLESVDPATEFLFEESQAIPNDKVLSFVSRRGHEEVRSRERAYHALPKDSVNVKWKFGDQEMTLKNPDSLDITHVIIDRRMDGHVLWKCYGIPKVVSAIDHLNEVLPSEGIVDLNVLSNGADEAKVRTANRRLRDPNAALLAELQGIWLMTAIVNPDGTIEPVSDPAGVGPSVHFKDSALTLHHRNGEEPVPMKFTLDASKPTPEIDIELSSGVFTLGFIDIKNGTLQFRLGEAGGKRPSDAIKPAVHCYYRRIPASLRALDEQEPEGALNPEDVQRQEAVIREATRQLKDPKAVLVAELQGKWILTGMATAEGFGAVSNPLESGHAIEFEKSTVVIQQGPGAERVTGSYVIDVSANSVEIDIKHENGQYTLGLIETKNGTLDLRLGDAGGDRPSEAIKPSIHYQYRRPPEVKP